LAKREKAQKIPKQIFVLSLDVLAANEAINAKSENKKMKSLVI
jgi:hypothetical protein